jgi:hypothetical protein
MTANNEFDSIVTRLKSEMNAKPGAFKVPYGFREVPSVEITEEDQSSIGGESYSNLGIWKYVRNYPDGSKIVVVHSSFDRLQTSTIRPDGNRMSVRVSGTTRSEWFGFNDPQ